MTLSCFGVFQEPNRPWTDHQWGLCVFDDVIEYTGPQALRYQQHFVEQMLHYASDCQPDVRQAAAYGLGVMGQHGGPEFAPGLSTNLILLPLIFFFKITDLPRGPMKGIFVICPVHQLPPFDFRTFKGPQHCLECCIQNTRTLPGATLDVRVPPGQCQKY